MKTWEIFLLGSLIIVLIILGIIFFKPPQETSNLILTAVNLFLVLGYVVATINMMRMNKIYISSLKTPVISVNLVNLKEELIEDEQTRINEPRLTLENKTNNYAKDVRVKVIALINDREYVGSYPINGEKDFFVQAKHTVFQKIKLEEEFLNRAGVSIQRMTELANESNVETQFVLKVKVSHSDGFGKKVELPELSWYFNFMKKVWNFIG